MAKRFRYAFAKKKEAFRGKLSVALSVVSLVLLALSAFLAFLLEAKYGFVYGGICLFAFLLSVYGFIMGLRSFSEENRKHRTSIVGSIGNGILMVAWIGLFLAGTRF